MAATDTIDQLKRWHAMLDNYEVTPVMQEIEEAIKRLEQYATVDPIDPPSNEATTEKTVDDLQRILYNHHMQQHRQTVIPATKPKLTMDDIVVGLRYQFPVDDEGLKKSLRGAVVEVVEKYIDTFLARVVDIPNRLSRYDNSPVGNRYNIRPSQVNPYKH